MAKGGRKKKEKRKDFQKVKFKVGKKKPQADNFTVTAFKSQAIQIREQLKSSEVDGAEPTTQRKKNIHDLLCHLNHYNVSIRQSTIAGMKELLSAHPTLITQHLPILIDSLSVLMTDKEDVVRKAGISLLQLVIQATPAKRAAPFFPVLSAHLTCAMTHLQEEIQLDSLAVLDLVLGSYPRLMTAHSKELLTVFVQLISRQRTKTVGWTEGGDEELAVKPGSRVSSHKWRRKVLLRLRQFLTAILEEHSTRHSLQADRGTAGGSKDYTVVVPGQEVTYAPIFAPGTHAHGFREEFVLGSSSSPSLSTSSQDLSQPDNLLMFVHSLVPLLLQCWMEVAPKSQEQSQAQLHAVAIEILDGVLSVIQLLWRWMQSVCEEKRDFRCMAQLQKLYHKKFINHLLPCFPYASHDPPAKAKRSGKGVPPATVVSLNLAACEIMSFFMTQANMESPWLRAIMAYVIEACIEGCDLSSGNMQSLLGVIQRLVKVLPSEESVSDLLQAVFSLYESCHILSANKLAMLQCLDDLLKSQGNRLPSSGSVDGLFLQSLPELVMELGSSTALQILLRRAAQCQPEALSCIQGHLKSIIDPEKGIFKQLAADVQVDIIHLIHHADPLDVFTLRSLATSCHDDRISAENVAYLINVLSTRFLDVGVSAHGDRKLPFSLPDFISFLFSVSVGSSQSDLSRLQETAQQAGSQEGAGSALPRCLTPIVIATKAGHTLQRYSTIAKSVCLSYSLISSKQQIWCIIETLITDLLNRHETIPNHTAYSLLYATNYLITAGTDWSQEALNKLTECCLAALYKAMSDDGVGIGNDDWSEALWDQAVTLLAASRPVLVALMQRIHSCVVDLTDPELVQRLAMVMIRLLQTQRLSSALAQTTESVVQPVHTLLNHRLATEGNRWMVELQYEARMVLKYMPQR